MPGGRWCGILGMACMHVLPPVGLVGSLALAMAAVLVSGACFCVDCKHAC